MGIYIFKRLILSIPTLIGVVVAVFFAVRLAPGDTAIMIAGEHATTAMVEEIRRGLGLDRGVHVQFGIFISNLATGNLGTSSRSGRLVTTEIWARLPNTIELALGSMLVAALVGISAGIISAMKQYSIFDNMAMVGALLGVSMPVFWQGLLMMLFFAVILGWLPVAGRGTFQHLILPSITLGTSAAAIIARMVRSSMLEVLQQEFITTARAKGLREYIVTYRHALRNAWIPVVTIMGLQLGGLMGGAVLTETVFAWPGVGRLMVDSIFARDFPVVQGTVLLAALIFVFANLFVDILYAFLDPRIRYE